VSSARLEEAQGGEARTRQENGQQTVHLAVCRIPLQMLDGRHIQQVGVEDVARSNEHLGG
jgi:hypothetical protein